MEILFYSVMWVLIGSLVALLGLMHDNFLLRRLESVDALIPGSYLDVYAYSKSQVNVICVIGCFVIVLFWPFIPFVVPIYVICIYYGTISIIKLKVVFNNFAKWRRGFKDNLDKFMGV